MCPGAMLSLFKHSEAASGGIKSAHPSSGELLIQSVSAAHETLPDPDPRAIVVVMGSRVSILVPVIFLCKFVNVQRMSGAIGAAEEGRCGQLVTSRDPGTSKNTSRNQSIVIMNCQYDWKIRTKGHWIAE